MIPCPAKAGQGTRISFSSGRNESALRQGFAAQNAWDAAALRGKSSRGADSGTGSLPFLSEVAEAQACRRLL